MPLFSLSLAFALSLFIAAMGYSGYSAFSEKQDVDKAVFGVVKLRENIQRGYQGRTGYDGISTARVAALGLLPAEFSNGHGPLNTSLTISNAGGRQFNIVIGNLRAINNSQLCTQLISSNRQAWQRRAVGSTVFTDDSIADIQAACRNANQVSLRSY